MNDTIFIALKRAPLRAARLLNPASAAISGVRGIYRPFPNRCEFAQIFDLYIYSVAPYITVMNEVATQVSLSANAAKQIKTIMAKQGFDKYLRVAVEGGGCSGFQYKFDFADSPNSDDLVIERDGAKVVIDDMSLEFLGGSEIDYTNELIGSAFKIHNPNATAGCGCGTSFSV